MLVTDGLFKKQSRKGVRKSTRDVAYGEAFGETDGIYLFFPPLISSAKDQSLFKINSLRDQRLYHSKKKGLFHSVILCFSCLFCRKRKKGDVGYERDRNW